MKLKNWFWEILEKSVRDATSMVCFCLFGKKRSRIMGFLSKIQKKVGPLNFNASGLSVSHLLYYLLNFSRYVLLQIYIRNADISKRDVVHRTNIGSKDVRTKRTYLKSFLIAR